MSGYIKMAKLDFITMKSQFWAYSSLALILILFWNMGSSVTVLCYSVSWFVPLFTATLFSLQEKNKLDRLYGTVSIKLKDIVLGRYVFTFLNFLLLYFATVILYSVTSWFQNQALQITEMIVGFSLSFLVFSLIAGLQMPMFFRMGYTKAKVWSLVPFSVILILLVAVQSLPWSVPSMIEFMLSNQNMLIIISILAGCLVQFISYQISVIAYRKRKRG